MNLWDKIDLKLQRANPSTRSHKLAILRRFFKHVGDKETYDQYDALAYLNSCTEHYSQSSQRQIHAVLSWFYRHILGQDLSGEVDRPDASDTRAPVLSHEDVAKMIEATKGLAPLPRTLVALATTYGTRRKEMQVQKEDIDLKNSRIFIRSAKKGFRRWMHIPGAILPILADYKVNYRTVGLAALSAYFWIVVERAGLNLDGQRIGWHSIRHRIIADLTSMGFTDYELVSYFRWQASSSQLTILYRYRSMTPEDELIEKIDKPILRVHPFLKYWR